MKKVSELTGAELDFWVAKAQGHERVRLNLKGEYGNRTVYVDHVDVVGVGLYKPSSSWAQGGPIIGREKITIIGNDYTVEGGWIAVKGVDVVAYSAAEIRGDMVFGETPLISAMRCYVASVYGEYVDE